MEWVLIFAIAVSFAIGVGLTYWLIQIQISQQKQEHLEQIHKTIEKLENNHEFRLKESIKSLQEYYDSQLNQATELLEKEAQLKLLNLRQEIQENAIENARQDFNSQKKQMENSFEQKYKVEFAKWKIEYEKYIRKSSLTASRSAIKGSVSEQLLPLIPGCKYNPGDMRFIGAPIDYIIFDGYDEAKQTDSEIKCIILADVKRGNRARLSPIQRKIKAAVEAGRVRWETIALDENLEISTTEQYNENFKRQPIVEPSVHFEPAAQKFSQFSSENSQELCRKILAWGNSGRTEYISSLIRYTNHQDGNVRRLTASAIGKIAVYKNSGTAIEQAIPALGRLIQDEKPQVRQYAVKALGLIYSDKVIPFLQQALNDSVGYVSEAANIALKRQNFRF